MEVNYQMNNLETLRKLSLGKDDKTTVKIIRIRNETINRRRTNQTPIY